MKDTNLYFRALNIKWDSLCNNPLYYGNVKIFLFKGKKELNLE